MAIERKKRLIVIDGNAVLHRAYHALPPLTSKKGEPINAVYGFLLVFLKALKEFKPDFVVVAFDFPAKTFRHKKYKLYKANRPKTPEELSAQLPVIKQILKIFEVPVFEKQNYEADDIIATISKKAKKAQIFPEIETIILSGDLDILGLVDKNTKAYILRKGVKDTILYDKKLVEEKYQGLSPEQLADFKGLRGDPSDNIPGVLGIGEKTAIFLIKKFGSLENIYSEIKKNSRKAGELNPGLLQKLLDCEEQAFISKALAEMNSETSLEFNLQKCRWGKYDKKKVLDILEKYNFKSLIFRFLEIGEKEKSEKSKSNLTLF